MERLATPAVAVSQFIVSRALGTGQDVLGIRAETVAALAIVPLVEVAWADGALEAKERRAVVERAGVPRDRDSAAGALLEAWLDRQPDPRLLVAWTHLAQAMSERLGPAGAARLEADLLERARAVAAAAGGLFGVGSRISAPEAAMLARLEAAFPFRP